ncbi:MAG TPA: type II toxin-antitoxin system PemK/MazF family toxin [bacterium]|nr:type II toxin-antitoxin system PemK/MazF family toxin [bacterium]
MWWANFPPPAGRRPAVLVSRDEIYDLRANVTVVPTTRTRRDIPTEVSVGRAEGLAGDTVANADDVTTIPRRLLTERAGVLAESKLKALDRALAFALALT